MRFFKGMGALLCAMALASCGGGGKDSGTSTTPGTPVAADLSLTLSANSLTNAGSGSITVTATAVDASRNALSGIPVSISVDNNAVIVVNATKTDANGQVTGTVTIGTDKSNRLITVTATSGTLVKKATFEVTGAKLQATVLQKVIAPSSPGEIQYRLLDVNDSPIANMPINISGAGVDTVDAVTDSAGTYKYQYTSPATAGTVTITATAAGVTNQQDIIVSSASVIPSVTVPITSASVSANPSVVPVNSPGSATNRTQVRALFLTTGNAPVANVRVRFDLAGDVNAIGGTLSSGSSVVYSDSNGIATTDYIPSTRSSPTNGVTVRACYFTDDASATAGVCSTSAQTTLTVISEPLSVTIGTDNTIGTGAGGLTYIKKFVVLVVDSSGQAKADVQISPSVDLLYYMKGWYDGSGGGWNRSAPSPAFPVPITGLVGYSGPVCPNEDVNRNGVLEATENDGLNHLVNGVNIPNNANGQLDPRKSDVAISMVGSSTTDSAGRAILQIEYPKNVGSWVYFKILVSASGVSGTEGRTTWSAWLPVEDGELKAETPPSFVVSPYGRGTTDSNNDGVVDCRDWD
jgi:hypothetical protein